MTRPKKPRCVSTYPLTASFVPRGIPVTGELHLTLEELEAIRLSDVEGLDQQAAADLMEVSRQTYGRVLSRARNIVGKALIAGQTIKIGGGVFKVRGAQRRCRRRGNRKPGE